MKPTKLTSWMMMLIFVLGGTTAKAQYFDDVYYTSKKKIANKEVANKQVKHSYYNENDTRKSRHSFPAITVPVHIMIKTEAWMNTTDAIRLTMNGMMTTIVTKTTKRRK